MKVKGTVLTSIDRFVKDNFPNKYKDWKNKLPDASKKLFNEVIMATQWYDVEYGVIRPTKLVGEMFYDFNVKKAAWDSGNYSAKVALTGIYKVFILISTPAFMMARAGKIMESFYDQAVIKVVENRSKGITLHMIEFPGANDILDNRIAGWMEKALEICGCKELQTRITKSIAKGDPYTEFIIDWV
jgi:hypothetical protein